MRYKTNSGWRRESVRHSLAAQGVETGRKRMFSNAFMPAISDSWFNWFGKREKLPSTNKVSEDNALKSAIKDSAKDWFGVSGMQGEKLVGGKGDGYPDEDFEPEELNKGVVVEMEHTNDPSIAKEITKDHLVETGVPEGKKLKSKYYENLEVMERNMRGNAQ